MKMNTVYISVALFKPGVSEMLSLLDPRLNAETDGGGYQDLFFCSSVLFAFTFSEV